MIQNADEELEAERQEKIKKEFPGEKQRNGG